MNSFKKLILPTATVFWLTLPSAPNWIRILLADAPPLPVATSTLEASLGCTSSCNGVSPTSGNTTKRTPIVELGKPEVVFQGYLNQDRQLADLVQGYTTNHPNLPHQRRIVITKEERRLTVYLDETPLKTYPISLGRQPRGDKRNKGDMRTPEGRFYIAQKNPGSEYYRALVLSYPATEDAISGLSNGIISKGERDAIIQANRQFRLPPQSTRLGSWIEIHGPHQQGYTGDWTWGCVALQTHDATDEIYAFARAGGKGQMPHTLVEIKP